MLDRLHARYGGTYSNGPYVARRYSRAEHVATSCGAIHGGKRRADFIAIDTFMPPASERTALDKSRPYTERNGSIHGHEVKVSRSDWRSELADPSKAEAWARHCHYWWLVAPEGIADGNLPAGWGLLIPWRNSLKIAVPAIRRDPEPMPTTMLASLARAITATETRAATKACMENHPVETS